MVHRTMIAHLALMHLFILFASSLWKYAGNQSNGFRCWKASTSLHCMSHCLFLFLGLMARVEPQTTCSLKVNLHKELLSEWLHRLTVNAVGWEYLVSLLTLPLKGKLPNDFNCRTLSKHHSARLGRKSRLIYIKSDVRNARQFSLYPAVTLFNYSDI